MDNQIPQSFTRPLDYDPFGMITFGRSWEAGTEYRYGFNGMEGDDEIVGNDNALDFGARVYDSRLGRWMSIDLLNEKYPQLSPYNFVNNNAILYRDYNGKDFIVSIDDDNKTITISATYYTETDRETARAQKAVMYLNGLSEDYVFIDDFGNQYNIVYDINVIQVAPVGTVDYKKVQYYSLNLGKTLYQNTSAVADNARNTDKSGKANSFKEDPSVEEYKALGFAGYNANEIRVAEPDLHLQYGRKPLMTDIHEILHTLGISHKLMGTIGINLDWRGVGTTLQSAGFKVDKIKMKYSLSYPTATVYRNGEKVEKGSKTRITFETIDKRPTLNIEEGGEMSGRIELNGNK